MSLSIFSGSSIEGVLPPPRKMSSWADFAKDLAYIWGGTNTLLNTPPKNLLKAFKEFFVFFPFGESIEGGQFTPSKDEIAAVA